MSALASYQRQLNRTTAAAWQTFEVHRARVWDVVRGASVGVSKQPRLRLIGAGNVNDVDLTEALTVFREIELVDVDDEALRRAIARQGLMTDSRIVLRGGVDIRTDPMDYEYFDVVVSCCALSQLIDSVVQLVEPECAESLQFVLNERDAHLATLLKGVIPGGAAVLITDFVSSDTAPALLNLATLSEVDVAALVSARNFFTACNPFILGDRLEALPTVARVLPKPPWIWHIAPGRSYAVVAFVAQTTTL